MSNVLASTQRTVARASPVGGIREVKADKCVCAFRHKPSEAKQCRVQRQRQGWQNYTRDTRPAVLDINTSGQRRWPRNCRQDELDTQSGSFLRNATARNFLGGRIKLVPPSGLDGYTVVKSLGVDGSFARFAECIRVATHKMKKQKLQSDAARDLVSLLGPFAWMYVA
ncbi:hypothetical protein PV325_001354 [Microctonus aethiopoides]|nr:hypothetical protein PV325_001354 [Microctonus aethiopoides]KAK0093586.1 hypothetical protein PV326_013182 [Microctonus aethiopoides]